MPAYVNVDVPANRVQPGRLVEPRPVGSPSRLWLLLVPLALLLLLVPLAVLATRADQPAAASDVRLVGPRGPAPVVLVLLLDESGSFAQYRAIRQQALEDLLSWSTVNLRADDVISVVSFTDQAQVTMKPTTVGDIAAGRAVLDRRPTPGDSTDIQPALRLAARTLPAGGAHSLVVVTDTKVGDADPTAVERVTRSMQISSMSLIVPDDTSVEADWAGTFPYEAVVTAPVDSAGQTSLAIAKAAGHATQQNVETIRKTS